MKWMRHNSTHTHLETYNIYSQTMMNDLTNNKTCMKQQQHEHAKSDNIHTQKTQRNQQKWVQKATNTKQNRRECKAASEWGALYDCQPVGKETPGEVPDKANNKSHLNSSFLKTCSFLSSSNSIPKILSSGAR